MKKLLTVIILCLCTLLLVGCKDEYEPVESTEEEARVVMTFSAGGKKYEVKYELYRALFLSNKSIVDGGDNTVWQGDDSATYVSRINEIIEARTYEIYSTIHQAKLLGYDAYSKDADNTVKEYVKGAVEGDDIQMGYGSYEAYLAALKKNHLNYSVADLMMRYSLSLDAINAYYRGTGEDVFGNSDREFQPTREAVSAYYMSEDCARILSAYIPAGVQDRVWVDGFRDELESKNSEYEMAGYIIANTLATESDLIVDDEVSGTVIGRSSLDSFFYSEYINTVFTIQPKVLSDIITITNSDADGYYIVYKLEKSEEHLNRCYDAVTESYVDNVIGEKLGQITAEFAESTEYAKEYSSITHSNISMD